jgi:hypothetical protein
MDDMAGNLLTQIAEEKDDDAFDPESISYDYDNLKLKQMDD